MDSIILYRMLDKIAGRYTSHAQVIPVTDKIEKAMEKLALKKLTLKQIQKLDEESGLSAGASGLPAAS